jgi:hypothetical protein
VRGVGVIHRRCKWTKDCTCILVVRINNCTLEGFGRASDGGLGLIRILISKYVCGLEPHLLGTIIYPNHQVYYGVYILYDGEMLAPLVSVPARPYSRARPRS